MIADGGFDVLSHAAESFVASNATPMTRALAGSAFAMAFHHLGASFRGDTHVRGQIHLASTMAGVAFSQAGLGMCHALSHSLGGMFHIPHGRLNAILLPEIVAANGTAAGKAYSELAKQAGLGGGAEVIAVRNLRNGLIRLRKELHLPANLQESGISPHKVRQSMNPIVAAALKDPCMATNPRKCDAGVLRSVLEAVIGRG